MPSAATSTATRASASNSPNTRSSAAPDGALDAIEADRLEREGTGLGRERGSLCVGGVGREADRERVGTGDAEGRCVGPSDEQCLAAPTGQRPFRDPDDVEWHLGAVRPGRDQDRAKRDAVARGDARRHDDRPARVDGRQGRGRITGREPQPPIGGEIRTLHRGGIHPHAADREIE